WVIGGVYGTSLSDVLYTTNGATWSQAAASTAMGAKSDGATCVYDNRMWYVGGYAIGVLNYNHVFYTCGSSIPAQSTPTRTVTPTRTAAIIYTSTPTRTSTCACTPTPVLTQATPVSTATKMPTPTPEPIATVGPGDSECHPTKAKDTIRIVFNTVKKAHVKIYIHDITGKLLKTADVETGETPNGKLYKVNIDIRDLKPGVYYYVIQGKDSSGELINFRSKKFIVKG
ncbi:MAG TPA: hypothetical protein P5511_07820, partial [Candidatus Goldiibacteriota bacterium]|nr:hypothetical protein [Candidatus Goldiibacteriota bacterium]